MSLAAGEVYWAIVPSTPRRLFKIHVADGTPVEVPTASHIVDGLRKGGDAEFEFVVCAKARPVPLLSGRSNSLAFIALSSWTRATRHLTSTP